MTITFYGHGDINYDNFIKQKICDELEDLIVVSGEIEFLLGGYGNFDIMIAHIIKSLKGKYPNIRSTLVIPYLERKYDMELYDGTIYPPIENIPKRIAIVKRNEWMINNADALITYVTHDWGRCCKNS